MGSHWAVLVAALLVVIGLVVFGVDRTNIAIASQPADGVHPPALSEPGLRGPSVKLDESSPSRGPRDDVAGIEVKSHGRSKNSRRS
jgi:hypothetical protein